MAWYSQGKRCETACPVRTWTGEGGRVRTAGTHLLPLTPLLLDQRPPLRGAVLSMFCGRGRCCHGGISRSSHKALLGHW